MKKLNLAAIIFVSVAIVVVVYNFFIVQPYLSDPGGEDYTQGFDYELQTQYRQISDWCGLIGTVLAALGLILGLMVIIKGKNKKGWIPVLAGIIVGVMSFVIAFAHVI
ncbi:MAG: hypothetical protein K0S32_2244 [Bacteroidetes bacterium]|jgi:hypothetical protein|nr:hypothetical protein [Bacteroidota bacterium]